MNFLLGRFGFFISSFLLPLCDEKEKFIPFEGQTEIQSRHPTHSEKLTFCSLISIHPVLQLTTHLWQELHRSLLIIILKKETFETNPSNAPTGQMVLQNNRPFSETSKQ